MRRAIGYVRVSKEAESGQSLEAQEIKIRAGCVLHDAELVEVIVERSESAKNLDRPGAQQVLGLVEKRAVDMVIVAKLDRLTRSVADLQDLVVLFNRKNVTLVSLNEFVDTGSAHGRMLLNLLTTVSQWEREAIGERTRDVLRHKREKGEALGGKAPYGYEIVEFGGKKQLVENFEEQRVIELIRELREDRMTLDGIAELLNERGHRTREGGDWRRQYIWRILKTA